MRTLRISLILFLQVWVNQYNTLSNNVPFGGIKQSGFGGCTHLCKLSKLKSILLTALHAQDGNSEATPSTSTHPLKLCTGILEERSVFLEPSCHELSKVK